MYRHIIFIIENQSILVASSFYTHLIKILLAIFEKIDHLVKIEHHFITFFVKDLLKK